MESQDKITYFAETDFRNKKVKFGIKAKDRTRHVYVIGKTGMGKSTMLENMAVQDIQNGEGMAFIDPHGGTAEKLLDYIPEHRIKDTIYFAPFDTDYPVSFNVMEDVGADKRHLVANGLMNAFKKIWVDAWSARMEYILNNVLLALLEYPDSTILGVNRMLSDKDYRNMVVAGVTDASVKAFWVDEFAKYGDKYMQEAGAAIQNKIGQFVSNPLVRNIIGQPKSSFDVRKIMDEKKILIMNLSKGRMGIENSALLGNMLVTKIYLGAMSRADATASELQKLPNFYFYVDEFQSFANESFADILSEARKYKLCLTIAHQYVNQMPEEVRDAVFGNVGSMVTFRIGPEDAELFEKEFAPEFTAEDLVNLGFAQVYLRLMIDGIGSKPFSSVTLPPISMSSRSFRGEIVENTRKNYATPRAEVETAVKIWYEPVVKPLRPAREKSKNDVAGESKPVATPLDSTVVLSVPPAKPHEISREPQKHNSFTTEHPQKRPERPINRPKEYKNDIAPVPPKPFLERSKNEIKAVSHTKVSIPPEVVAVRPIVHIDSRVKPITPLVSTPSTPPIKPNVSSATPPPPVSLSHLKPAFTRTSSGPTKNTMALKSALEAALKEKQSIKPAKPIASIQTSPQISPNNITQSQPPKSPETLEQKPREVPEDILRKVLE